MTENKHGINVEIDEDNTTRAANDVFEKAELKFPCDFPISVMGLNVPEYKEKIFAILKKHVPELEEKNLQTAYSANKNTARSRHALRHSPGNKWTSCTKN